jgi:hypothetical protein
MWIDKLNSDITLLVFNDELKRRYYTMLEGQGHVSFHT